LDFENEQGKRVKTIIDQREYALGRIEQARRAKVTNTVVNGMPLIEEHSFMRWECDTDDGGVAESKDEFDSGKHLSSAL
jgi:hypothetical protein